jgi:hypothetical protein
LHSGAEIERPETLQPMTSATYGKAGRRNLDSLGK